MTAKAPRTIKEALASDPPLNILRLEDRRTGAPGDDEELLDAVTEMLRRGLEGRAASRGHKLHTTSRPSFHFWCQQLAEYIGGLPHGRYVAAYFVGGISWQDLAKVCGVPFSTLREYTEWVAEAVRRWSAANAPSTLERQEDDLG